MYNSNFFNWLFDVNSAGGFFKKLGITFLSIVLLIGYIIGIGSIAGRVMTSSRSAKGYIMVNSSTLNFIVLMICPALAVGLIILYFVTIKFLRDEKRYYNRYSLSPLRDHKSSPRTNVYRIIFAVLLSGTVALFIYSLNNYFVVFQNRIEMHNILNSRRHTYSYEDIREVSIGVKARGRYGGDLTYRIKFKNGKTINLGSSAISYEDDPIKSVNKINDIIKDKGIVRKIDKTHFHDLTEKLGEEYIKEYERMFAE